MIDPGYDIVDLRHRDANVIGEFAGGVLYTVAETDRCYFSRPTSGPTIHGHRIDVV